MFNIVHDLAYPLCGLEEGKKKQRRETISFTLHYFPRYQQIVVFLQ